MSIRGRIVTFHYREFNLSKAIDKKGAKYIKNIKIVIIAITKLLGSLFNG